MNQSLPVLPFTAALFNRLLAFTRWFVEALYDEYQASGENQIFNTMNFLDSRTFTFRKKIRDVSF